MFACGADLGPQSRLKIEPTNFQQPTRVMLLEGLFEVVQGLACIDCKILQVFEIEGTPIVIPTKRHTL